MAAYHSPPSFAAVPTASFMEPSPPSPNRLVHALTWVNALELGPKLTLRNMPDHFRSGVLLCRLLERVVRPKPDLTTLHCRPLARRQAISNLEMVNGVPLCRGVLCLISSSREVCETLTMVVPSVPDL